MLDQQLLFDSKSYIKMYSLRLKPFVVRLRANISAISAVTAICSDIFEFNCTVNALKYTKCNEEEREKKQRQRIQEKDLSDTSNKNHCHFSTEIESPEEIQIAHIRQIRTRLQSDEKKIKRKENRCKTAISNVKKTRKAAAAAL